MQKNEGIVHGDEVQSTLLIDIKDNGVETYKALDALLSRFNESKTEHSGHAIGLVKRPLPPFRR